MSRCLVPVLLSSFLLLPESPAGVSYRRLKGDKETAFYQSGGRTHRNQRVHLHVQAQRLLGKPEKIIPLRRGGRLLRFKNRSVPLLLSPRNIYFRKILQRAKPGSTLCVKGTVRAAPMASPGDLALYVKVVKTAP